MENVDEESDNYAVEVTTMSLDSQQSDLGDICQSYSGRPLNTKHKSVICYQPNSDLFHYGVISPVAPDAPIEKFQC